MIRYLLLYFLYSFKIVEQGQDMNLMSVTSITLYSKINLLNRRAIWFIKTFSFVLRFHFPKIASSGSSFGSERKPATLLLSVSQEEQYGLSKLFHLC